MNRIAFKQKNLHEFTEYWINVVYLSLFFGSVLLYRRLILAQHGIALEDYFAGILKALVFPKVIMIGSFLSINRIFEHKPLIIPTIYKAVLFTLWVMIFDIAWGLYDYTASPMYVAFPRCHLLSVSDIVFFEGYDPYGGSLYNPTPSLINPGG